MSVNYLLRGRQMLINAFKRTMSPMKNMNINDDDYFYDDDFDPPKAPKSIIVKIDDTDYSWKHF